MNVALMGSVSSSWFALDALIRGGVEVTAVLGLDESQAERVSDYRSLRGRADKAGLPFLPFIKVTEPAVEAFLTRHRADLLWVIGLSQMVPERLIRLARHGAVGFHPTMLPRGRGRAPVAWTILLNEPAAVSLFCLTDEPDAGDIIVQRPVPVEPDDYSEDLIQRTNEVLAEVVLELVPAIKAGKLPQTPQDHAKATYYAKRTPADGAIDWTKSTDEIYRLIRAGGRPYPGAFGYLNGRKVIIWRARLAPAEERSSDAAGHAAGTVERIDPSQGILTRGRDGALWLSETNPDLTAAKAGRFFNVGDRFSTEDPAVRTEP